MKRLIVTALCTVLLAACEITPGSGPPPVGATVQTIEPGRFRVVFRGRSRASPAEVGDRALLMAAQTTLGGGYDWFEVVDRASDIGPPTSPRFSFGIGGGSFGRRSGVGVSTATGFGGEPTAIAILEVIAGRGAKPADRDAYDARAVVDSLSARLS